MSAIATITGEKFDAMPFDEGRHSELINGELAAVSSATPYHRDLMLAILLALCGFFQERAIGVAYPGVEFVLSENDRLRPDVYVLIAERAHRLDRHKIPMPGCPDIAIEVISPTERASESYAKVRAYLHGGTAEVWQVYPKSQTVQIHRGEISRSIEWTQPIESELLPGFALQLSSVFE